MLRDVVRNSVARTIARNIAASWLGQFVSVAVAVLLTPIVVRRLGLEQFGIWALVSGLTGYYGLLDIGFRSGLNRYMTRYYARKDYEELSRVASTGTAVLSISGLIVVLCAVIISYLFPLIFNVAESEISDARFAVLVVGLATAVQFPFFVQSAVFVSTQRFDLSNGVGIVETLCRAAAVLVGLASGGGLSFLACAISLNSLAFYLVRFYVARRLLPGIRIGIRLINKKSFKELFGFSAWALLVSLSKQLTQTANICLIGIMATMAMVGQFEVAMRVAMQIQELFNPFANTVFPALVTADEEGGRNKVAELYVTGSSVIWMIMIPVVAIAWCWAPQFYSLWLPQQILLEKISPSSDTLFRFLVLASALRISQYITGMVFHTYNQLRLLSLLYFGEAVVCLILSAITLPKFGLMGVAMSAIVASAAFQAMLLPLFACRIVQLPWSLYWKRVGWRTALPCMLSVVGVAGIKQVMPADNWLHLFVSGLLAIGWSAVCVFFTWKSPWSRTAVVSGASSV